MSNKITEFINKERALLEAATPGPWTVSRKEIGEAMTLVGNLRTNKYSEYKSGSIAAQTYATTIGEAELNAEFISNVRTSHAQCLKMLEIAMEELNSNYLNVKNCSCCSVKAGKLKEAIARIEKLAEKKP